jgi:hypothetical protein
MALPNSIRRSIGKQSQHVLETGSRFTRFDQIRQRHFWSSYYFTPDANGYIGAGTFPLFTIPVGQNGQGFPSGVSMSERETNWKSQNRVPDNQNFEITEIGVSLGMTTPDIVQVTVPPNLPDRPSLVAVDPQVMNEFINNSLVNITYLTNSVPLGLACDFGQASAPHNGTLRAGVNTGSAPTWVRSNGFPAPALRRRFKIPILLQHGETFSFSFQIPRSYFIGLINTGGQTPVNTGVSPFIARFDFWATESFVE